MRRRTPKTSYFISLLADHSGEVEEVGGDVEAEGVGDVLDLLELHLGGVEANRVEGELLHETRLHSTMHRQFCLRPQIQDVSLFRFSGKQNEPRSRN
jgi:hypothetical protein